MIGATSRANRRQPPHWKSPYSMIATGAFGSPSTRPFTGIEAARSGGSMMPPVDAASSLASGCVASSPAGSVGVGAVSASVAVGSAFPDAGDVAVAVAGVSSAPSSSSPPQAARIIEAITSRASSVGIRLNMNPPNMRQRTLARDRAAAAAIVGVAGPRVLAVEARDAERREVGRLRLAVDDPLGQAAADGRGRLERAARVTDHDVETGDLLGLVDDRPVVGAHRVEAGPAAAHDRVA